MPLSSSSMMAWEKRSRVAGMFLAIWPLPSLSFALRTLLATFQFRRVRILRGPRAQHPADRDAKHQDGGDEDEMGRAHGVPRSAPEPTLQYLQLLLHGRLPAPDRDDVDQHRE